ncbi:MAG: hypothetical protein ACTSW4_01105, partial [Candidatus Ranarchaeia archaeon]
MYNVKIQGIYATALTLYLIEQGFKVTRVTPTIRNRLPLEVNEVPADIEINDRWNTQGITVVGEPDAFYKLTDAFLDDFPGVIAHNSLAGSGSVYKAIVKRSNMVKGYSLIDLGNTVA